VPHSNGDGGGDDDDDDYDDDDIAPQMFVPFQIY